MDSIILHTQRMDLRQIIRDQLEKHGVKDIKISKETKECTDFLSENPRSLLIIDFEVGRKEVQKILESTQKIFKIETRPIIMISKDLSPEVTAVCHEFGINKIHAGQISRATISTFFYELSKEEEVDAPIRDSMVKVAELRMKGKTDDAIKSLTELSSKIPKHYKVIGELASAHISKDNWQEAKMILEPLAKKNPGPRILGMLGRVYLKEGNYKAASEVLQDAKILNPYNIDRLIELGQVFLNLYDTENAMDNFNQASKLDPKNKDAKAGEAQCLLIEGDVNEALTLMNEINSEQEKASIFNMSAVIAMRTGHYKKGMDLYNQALEALKESNEHVQAKLMFNKGVGFQRWSKKEEAYKCFQDALKMDPSFTKAKNSFQKLGATLGLANSPLKQEALPVQAIDKTEKKIQKPVDDFSDILQPISIENESLDDDNFDFAFDNEDALDDFKEP